MNFRKLFKKPSFKITEFWTQIYKLSQKNSQTPGNPRNFGNLHDLTSQKPKSMGRLDPGWRSNLTNLKLLNSEGWNIHEAEDLW